MDYICILRFRVNFVYKKKKKNLFYCDEHSTKTIKTQTQKKVKKKTQKIKDRIDVPHKNVPLVIVCCV